LSKITIFYLNFSEVLNIHKKLFMGISADTWWMGRSRKGYVFHFIVNGPKYCSLVSGY